MVAGRIAECHEPRATCLGCRTPRGERPQLGVWREMSSAKLKALKKHGLSKHLSMLVEDLYVVRPSRPHSSMH